MRVDQIMMIDPIVANPLMTLEAAARLMRDYDIGALPVVKNGKLVGIVTDRDMIIRAMAEGKDGFMSRVSDVMTSTVHCCSPHEDVQEVVTRMARLQVRRLLIVEDDGKLAGIITIADVTRYDDVEGGFALSEICNPVEAGVVADIEAAA